MVYLHIPDEMSEYLGYNVELNNDVDRTPLIIIILPKNLK